MRHASQIEWVALVCGSVLAAVGLAAWWPGQGTHTDATAVALLTLVAAGTAAVFVATQVRFWVATSAACGTLSGFYSLLEFQYAGSSAALVSAIGAALVATSAAMRYFGTSDTDAGRGVRTSSREVR